MRLGIRSAAVAALCLAAVAVLIGAAAAQSNSVPSVANVGYCHVVEAEQANLPPLEAGVIDDVKVKEGTEVKRGDLLVQLDASKVFQEARVAEAKYDAAKTKADDRVQIEYAKAATEVADATYEISAKANKEVRKSVPEEKLLELKLKCVEAKLQIKKATIDQQVAQEEAKVAKAEWDAAEVTVGRHKLNSPISGEVVKIMAHNGEAVQPSQPIVRVVNLETLWVEGDVPAKQFARSELDGQPATVEVETTRGETASFTAEVVYVSPLTDTGGTYKVRAAVKNRKLNGKWLLGPGIPAKMNIQVRRFS
jgi:HlyD family secretion protein